MYIQDFSMRQQLKEVKYAIVIVSHLQLMRAQEIYTCRIILWRLMQQHYRVFMIHSWRLRNR